MNALELKEEGNKHFKANEYEEALTCYTKALELCDPSTKAADKAVYLKNRAACHLKLSNPEKAANDASKGEQGHFSVYISVKSGIRSESIYKYKTSNPVNSILIICKRKHFVFLALMWFKKIASQMSILLYNLHKISIQRLFWSEHVCSCLKPESPSNFYNVLKVVSWLCDFARLLYEIYLWFSVILALGSYR